MKNLVRWKYYVFFEKMVKIKYLLIFISKTFILKIMENYFKYYFLFLVKNVKQFEPILPIKAIYYSIIIKVLLITIFSNIFLDPNDTSLYIGNLYWKTYIYIKDKLKIKINFQVITTKKYRINIINFWCYK